ncbi:MAG TPA: hypothetical protein VER33_23875 [Polyangiaceae bacterium]|nr:hypothetical protein [Polyangiaceae bacterium]
MTRVQGMVLVAGTTYRIECKGPSQYRVVRILDDAPVGSFCTAPRLELMDLSIDPILMRQIARAAVATARTNWDRLQSSALKHPALKDTEPKSRRAPSSPSVPKLEVDWSGLGLSLQSGGAREQ